MKLKFDIAQQSGSVGNDIDRRNKQWSVFFSLEDVPVLDYAGTPDSVLEGCHALRELSLDLAPIDEPSCSLPSILLQTHNPVEDNGSVPIATMAIHQTRAVLAGWQRTTPNHRQNLQNSLK